MSAEMFGASDVECFMKESRCSMYEDVPAQFMNTAMSSFYIPASKTVRAMDRKMVQAIDAGMVDVRSALPGDGRTVLHLVAEFGYARCAFALVRRHRVPVDARDRKGRTPLMRAAAAGMGVTTVRMLLALGADVRAADRKGRTALHAAAATGSGAIGELILGGADPSARDSLGNAPLDYARRSDDAAFATELLLDELGSESLYT
jgi:ankyrin repeat protein